MIRRAAILAALICAVLSLGGLAAATVPAPAGGRDSTFQDDNLLVYNTPLGVARTLNTLASLGVDRVRVSVFWNIVAPNATSTTRPANFNAADPSSYPAGAWNRYDTLVTFAKARGIAVNFDLTDPAPLWATRDAAATRYPEDLQPFAERVRPVRAGRRDPLQRDLRRADPNRGHRRPGTRRPPSPGSTTGRSGTSRTRPAG